MKLAPDTAGFKPLARRGLGRAAPDWSNRGMSKIPSAPEPATEPATKPLNAVSPRPSKLADKSDQKPVEIGGAAGPEPTRYGDWERNGRCTDF